MRVRMLRAIRHFIDSRCHNHEERQCIIVYLVGVAMVLAGMPLHFAGLLGIDNCLLHTVSAASWVASAMILAFYMKGKLRLTTAISIFTIMLQLAESIRIIYNVEEQPDGFEWSIMLNQTISLIVIIYLVMGFVRLTPIVNTAISLATLAFACWRTGGAVNFQMLTIFTFVEVATCLVGGFMQRSVHTMQRENTSYKDTEEGLLNAFHMTKAELAAYIHLCRQNSPDEKQVSAFFDMLDEHSEANLTRAVELRMAERHIQRADFAAKLPQLTPTELEVCRLVIVGKTLAEIARILGKSTNNISSVRIHVRKKMGLQPKDDLRQALMEATKEPERK